MGFSSRLLVAFSLAFLLVGFHLQKTSGSAFVDTQGVPKETAMDTPDHKPQEGGGLFSQLRRSSYVPPTPTANTRKPEPPILSGATP